MQELLENNRSAFQVEGGRVQNPKLCMNLGSMELELTTHRQLFFFSNFDRKISWELSLKEAESLVSKFSFDVKYDSVESGTAQGIKPPMAINVDFENQRRSLADLYSGIFSVIDDFRQQKQGKALLFLFPL